MIHKFLFASILAALMTNLVSAKRVTNRSTFLLGYKDQRCFKEMFYHGSTLELYAELIEPESMKDQYIKDPSKDGVRYIVVFDANKSIVKEGILGNKMENSYVSFNNHIDIPNKEGVYRVCMLTTDSIFHNAAESTDKNQESDGMFGKIFQQ